VHLEVFSEKNFFNKEHRVNGGWRLVEDDSDKNVICRSKQAMSKVARLLVMGDQARLLIEQLGWGGTEASTQNELVEQRAKLRDRLPALRTLVTRNTSYWAVDWQKVKDENEAWAREFGFDDEDVEAAEKYAWWEECIDKEVPLPEEPFVYHYHPVAFLEYLDEQLPQPTERDTQGAPQSVSCEQDPCPLEKALDLQKDYFEALEALKETKTGTKDDLPLVDRLKMAEFVRDVAARAAGQKVVPKESGTVELKDAPGKEPWKAEDAWPSLRVKREAREVFTNEEEASSYEDTFLKRDIEEMRGTIDEKK
jgi:hypothetical protein